MKKFISTFAAIAMAGAAYAGPVIEINYQNLDLLFSGGLLTLGHRTNSVASAFAKDGVGTTLDSADIFNILPGADFGLLFSAAVVNGGGTDDISMSGTFQATDTLTTLGTPSIDSTFTAANLTGDVDGVSFGAGVLRVEGVIGVNAFASILANPAGDWTYVGSALGTPAGLDGIMDQITIGSAIRGDYQAGILAILEITLNTFKDGTSTAGLNADQLFAMAAAHGGFSSTDAQIQLVLVPVPGAILLGMLGMGAVAYARRRLA